MTIEQAIARVKKDLNVSTDDHSLSEEWILSILKSVRSRLLRQEANKDQLWNGGSAQYKAGIELHRDTVSELQEFKACTVVYKTIDKLPKLVDTKYGKIILGVYLPNGVRLELIEYADWEATRKRRYSLPCAGYAFLRNERIYVIDYYTDTPCLFVDVEGIYEDPEEVADGSSCDYIGDIEFNVPGYLEQPIFDTVVPIVARKYNIPVDTRNNGREDIQQQPQT